MSELVYISDWEIQCCGEDFAVGDRVAWPVRPAIGHDDYWETFLGPDLAGRLWGAYQGHDEEEPPRVTGTVRGIRSVTCRFAPLPPPAEQRELHVVPGTARFEPIDAIDKWYDLHDDVSGRRSTGWLVDLDVAD